MQSYNERLNALLKRAAREKSEKLTKKQEAYYRIKDQVFSSLESAENLVDGITIEISSELIQTAFSTIDENSFATQIRSDFLSSNFHVTYHGQSSDGKSWRYYINYAR